MSTKEKLISQNNPIPIREIKGRVKTFQEKEISVPIGFTVEIYPYIELALFLS